jgi:hypothetical protein
MYDAYPKVKVVTAWVDEKLNEQKYIVPGLGGEYLLFRYHFLLPGGSSVTDVRRFASLLSTLNYRFRRSLLHIELISALEIINIAFISGRIPSETQFDAVHEGF